MATTTTVRKIGNSFDVILGKDVLEQLGVRPGDVLFVVPARGSPRAAQEPPTGTIDEAAFAAWVATQCS